MGGLLHLVQRGGDWARYQSAQAPPRCTKCYSPPINGQCTNFMCHININMKLVHWPLIGGLLHLVQRWGVWAGWGPAQSLPRCTKCSDVKFHEIFLPWNIAHEILHISWNISEIFKKFHDVFFRLYTHPFNILYTPDNHYLSFIYAYCSSLSLSAGSLAWFACLSHFTP